jgi:hypothetical protein
MEVVMDVVTESVVEDVDFLPARERWDPMSYAVASFLAPYRGLTLRAYRQDMLAFLRWCAERQLEPLTAERPHLELYLRWMEAEGLAPATIGRRFGTVAGFYKYAVIDGNVTVNPTLAVTGRGSRGRANAARCCTPWSTPRCSPRRATTAPRRTRWSLCSGCWA